MNFDKRLREKDLGIFEGLTSEEAREQYPETFQLFKTAGANYVIDQGESTQQLLDRALEAIEEIRLRHPQKVAVLVTHGGVVRVLMKHVLGVPLDTPTQFLISNTGIFRLVWRDKWIVAEMGALPHQEKKNNVAGSKLVRIFQQQRYFQMLLTARLIYQKYFTLQLKLLIYTILHFEFTRIPSAKKNGTFIVGN